MNSASARLDPAQLSPLPKKQAKSASQEKWVAAWDAARSLADDSAFRAAIHEKMAEAAERIEARLRTCDEPVIAWSGGKDSIAVEAVSAWAGFTRSFIAVTHLEYTDFMEWVLDRQKEGQHDEVGGGGIDLHLEWMDKFNWDWMSRHQQMMFPRNGREAGKWFVAVQHAGQRSYAKRHGVDLMLTGRRTSDGNYCGNPSPLGGHEYRDPKGFQRYSPISDWSHEDVLACLAVTGHDLPPVYRYPRGFTVATGPWAKRKVGSDHQGWSEVFASEPSIVEEAARRDLRGARDFLASLSV